MVDILSDKPISIEDVISENAETIEKLKTIGHEGLRRIAKELPPGFHKEMRDKLLEVLIRANGLGESALKVKIAIDSNIIISDAFRVARGKSSTTDRVLQSPFIEVFAPPIIWEEVERSIRNDLPKGASLDLALDHARKLLGHVKEMTPLTSSALLRAQAAIASHSPEDVPLLAIAIENEVEAIVSRDKRAFGAETSWRRWDFGRSVEVITSYEVGSLSIAITGAGTEMLSEALQKIAIWIALTTKEILEVVVSVLGGLRTGIADALSNVPDWVWLVILSVGMGVLVGALVSRDFREMLGNGFEKLYDIISPILKALVQSAKAIWQTVRFLLVVAWNLVVFIAPFILAAAGVLLTEVHQLFETISAKEKGWPHS